MTTTGDSVSSIIVMSFVIRIVTCWFCSPIGTSCPDIEFKWAYVLLLTISTGATCSGTISCSMGDISQLHFSIYVDPSKTFTTFTARFIDSQPVPSWQVSHLDDEYDYAWHINHLHSCGSQFWRFKTLNGTFPLKLWVTVIFRVGLASASTWDFVKCITVFVRPIMIRNCYVDCVGGTTSVCGISHST